MSTISKLTTRRKSSQLRKKSKTSSSLIHPESGSETFRSAEPQLRQEDIINQFFDQFLDLIIEKFEGWDSVDDGSQKQPSSEDKDEDDTVLKHFKSISWEDLVNFDIVAVSGSNVYLRKKEKSEGDSPGTSSTSLKDSSYEEVVSSTTNLKNKYGTSSAEASPRKRSPEVSTKSNSSASAFKTKLARIVFTNGNVYQGEVLGKQMHGIGSYYWSDGTIYQGQFLNGSLTGVGQMVMPDLSKYEGQFCRGLFHGKGVLNKVATMTVYCGEWNHGKREGNGWLLYEADNWYDGQWFQDLRHGSGLRRYKDGTVYKGNWFEGKPSGFGEMIWANYDHYIGNWLDGKFSGYGEYTWDATFNNTFTFPKLRNYRGQWLEGKREGQGVFYLGYSTPGGTFKGNWSKNLKHGECALVCGNRLYTNNNPYHFNTDALELSQSGDYLYQEVPIRSVPDLIDVDICIKGVLNKIKDLKLDSEKTELLIEFERKQVYNTLTRHLPSLRELYDRYATFTAEGQKLDFSPVLTRMFLWQFYKDKELHKLGLSLIDTDRILYSIPQGTAETLHNPFETILFYQFLVSIVGTALHGDLPQSLDEFERGGVSAFILNEFIKKVLLSASSQKGPPSWKYKNMVPITDVYALYLEIGEPHSVKDFMRRTCFMRHEKKTSCKVETPIDLQKFKKGHNAVPLCDRVVFIEAEEEKSDGIPKNVDTSNLFLPRTLRDFHKLGSKAILDCIAKECPLVFSEGLLCNMDYPLTFLEFYNILLSCIFLMVEKNMVSERDKLQKTSSEQDRVDETIEPAEEQTKKKRQSRK